jgi:TPR repeat protein
MLRALTIIVLLAGFAAPAAADFDEGLAAYSQGDFDTARAAFEPLADVDTRALFYLGRMYVRGEGVAADPARGLALLERAAEAGVAAAMAAAAGVYKRRGETQKAFQWITKAAEAGLPFAQAELGEYYETGTGVAQNRREAIIWYGKAARGGRAIGAAQLYLLGADENRDKHGSLGEVRQRIDRAHAGDSQARFELAALFTDVGAHAQAFDWYRLAADQGHHGAEYEVAFSYLTGRGVGRAESAAVVWFRRAVGGGHPVAMYQLGNVFRFGLGGIDVHEGLALEWYENAVEDGYSAATHDVVDMYVILASRAAKVGNLDAAREEIVEAIAWYERGVRLGDPEVSFAFARNLDRGFGGLIEEDDRSALAFYEIAAQQGSLGAVAELVRHLGGDGDVEADLPAAYFWSAILAADDPDDQAGFGVEAAADRDLLASELSNAQIDAANARADAWRAQYRTMPPVAAK